MDWTGFTLRNFAVNGTTIAARVSEAPPGNKPTLVAPENCHDRALGRVHRSGVVHAPSREHNPPHG